LLIKWTSLESKAKQTTSQDRPWELSWALLKQHTYMTQRLKWHCREKCAMSSCHTRPTSATHVMPVTRFKSMYFEEHGRLPNSTEQSSP
jgi:hypothetical protein